MEIILEILGLVKDTGVIIIITIAFMTMLWLRKYLKQSIDRQDKTISKVVQDTKEMIENLSNILLQHSEDNRTANQGVRDFVMKISGDLINLEKDFRFMKTEMKEIKKVTKDTNKRLDGLTKEGSREEAS
ncbi:MAG: hypothetical protein LBV41_04805 [Cytophagaceae bacterium]|jgi:hypothetical protein|nr:hypothetical protein [Cytophagaceae bacterium]